MNLYTDDELDLILHCINNTDTSRWDEEEAKKLRLLEAKIRINAPSPQAEPSPLDRVLSALENGHNCADCIDRDTPRYCAGLYWPLWSCRMEGITEGMVRAVWPEFPGFPDFQGFPPQTHELEE